MLCYVYIVEDLQLNQSEYSFLCLIIESSRSKTLPIQLEFNWHFVSWQFVDLDLRRLPSFICKLISIQFQIVDIDLLGY